MTADREDVSVGVGEGTLALLEASLPGPAVSGGGQMGRLVGRLYGLGKSYLRVTCRRALKSSRGTRDHP